MSTHALWSSLHDRLHQTLRQRQLLSPRQRVLVAVSGGQDSLCLAQLMVDLLPKWSWQLAIAHCDHRWQFSSAAAVRHVQRQAEHWELPFLLQTAPDSVAQDRREATARTWRYAALAHLAESGHYSAVLTAHTASDRAETLLYNLLRGSGMNGLQALSWQRSLTPTTTLVRPLLNVIRSETRTFCHQRDLHVWDDPSNQDLHYRRNQIRHEVMPYLCDRFNPNLERVLAQTAELMRAEVDYLESETEAVWLKGVQTAAAASSAIANPKSGEAGFDYRLKIDRHYLRQVPLALQRRVMRRCLRQLLPAAPQFDHIEKLVRLIHAPNKSQTDPFPGGAIARVEEPWILLV